MGDIKYYKHITGLIITSFIINLIVICLFNILPIAQFFSEYISEKKLFVIQLFFWSALGATIACSLFLSEDKEMNELESLKETPDPLALRYPDSIDVFLYFQRIITSGILGIIGALILFAGLGFFDAQIETLSLKHKLFFIIYCFLIGMYQRNFITYLSNMFKKMLQEKTNKGLNRLRGTA